MNALVKKMNYKYPVLWLLGLIPFQYRNGREFRRTYKFLMESQWWSFEHHKEYQLQQLRKLVKHAYDTVPFYKNLYDEHGIKPEHIQNFSDFQKLPVITREVIRDNLDQFLSTSYSKNMLEPAKTSGTTSGGPLNFWREKRRTSQLEKAFVWRMWINYGAGWSDRSLVIKGSYGINELITYNPAGKILSIFNPIINKETIKKYVSLISKFNPENIKGYPSLIYSIAYLMLKNDIKIQCPKLKFIYCHSEKIFEFQRDVIEQVFSTKVYTQYGHTERLIFFHQCELNNYYHINTEYGYTELINVTEDLVSAQEIGELVGTGFNNYAFPLIRYKTDDWATISKVYNCSCNRNYPIVKDIVGRSGDFIITPSGSLISPTVFEFAIASLNNYKDVQVVQTTKDLVEVKIVPDELYSDNEGENFVNIVREMIGNDMKINVILVNDIKGSVGNKKRFVYSELYNNEISKIS